MRTLYELQQDRREAELAALETISDAASAAADINLDTGENGRLVEALSPGQQGKILAEKQTEVLREARNRGKGAYIEANLTYQALIQERHDELTNILFSKTATMDASTLVSASVAGEDALRSMAKVAATSGNEELKQAILLSAYERDMVILHELIRLLDDEGEDEDGTLADLFAELAAVADEITPDIDLLGEQLEVRYDRLVQPVREEDLMPGNPKRSVLLRG